MAAESLSLSLTRNPTLEKAHHYTRGLESHFTNGGLSYITLNFASLDDDIESTQYFRGNIPHLLKCQVRRNNKGPESSSFRVDDYLISCHHIPRK